MYSNNLCKKNKNQIVRQLLDRWTSVSWLTCIRPDPHETVQHATTLLSNQF